MPAKVKIETVQQLKDILKDNPSFVVVDYRGIDAEQIKALRKEFRANGVTFSVVKNNLFKIALHEAELPPLDEVLTGPTAVAFSLTDITLSAKRLKEVATGKEPMLAIKAGLMEGTVLDEAGVIKVADLPSREVLLSQLVGAVQGPISGFVFSLKGIINNLVYTLHAIKEKKDNAA